MNTALQIVGDRVVSPEIFQDLKQDALMAATLVEFVNDVVTHDHAVSVQSDISTCRRTIEKSRKELKAPVLALGKLIDATAATEDKDLEVEEKRIAAMVSDFQAIEYRRAIAAANAKRFEEERIERERQAELRKIQEEQEAVRRKLSEEAAAVERAVREARNTEEAAAAAALQRQIDRQWEIAKAESIEKLDAIDEKFNAASAALPTVEMHRAEGQRVTVDWDIVVSDIWSLARAHPACVKIEPRLAEIKKLLDMDIKVHGVTATKKVSSTTTRRAIDI